MSIEKQRETLKNQNKCDILTNEKALETLQAILNRKNTAEVFQGKYGIVIREIRRKDIYTPQ